MSLRVKPQRWLNSDFPIQGLHLCCWTCWRKTPSHANWTTNLKWCLEMLCCPVHLCVCSLSLSLSPDHFVLNHLFSNLQQPLSNPHSFRWSYFLSPSQNRNNQKRATMSSHPALPPFSMDELSMFLLKANTSTCFWIPFPLAYIETSPQESPCSPFLKKRTFLCFHMPHYKYPFLFPFAAKLRGRVESPCCPHFLCSYVFGYWLKNPPRLGFNYRKRESRWGK